ncbi:MAG: type II toxin-antitoxin system Phd/YefM family antitoxin [Pseudomonadota bacterium]
MWTLQDAKSKFSAVVKEALAGRPQEVSKSGKSAVVVLSYADYARLLDVAHAACGSFLDHLAAFPGEPGEEIESAEAVPRDVAL